MFLISPASDLRPGIVGFDDLYLTILDRKYMEQIDEVRWKIRDGDGYWHTGSYKTPLGNLKDYFVVRNDEEFFDFIKSVL